MTSSMFSVTTEPSNSLSKFNLMSTASKVGSGIWVGCGSCTVEYIVSGESESSELQEIGSKTEAHILN